METNDDELIQIFLEEAHELTGEITGSIGAWQATPNQIALLAPILRALHTLKGSARMLNFSALGEYVHGLEQIIQLVHTQQLSLPMSKLKALLALMDGLNEYIEDFFQLRVLPTRDLPIEQLKGLLHQLKKAASPIKNLDSDLTNIEKKPRSNEQTPQTVAGIKIKVERLDSMSKLASQINISRSHLEQQVGEMRKLMAEVTKELSSLPEQLHHVQLEVNSRLKPAYEFPREFEEFDAIEFERFPALQQAVSEVENKIKQVESLNTFASEIVRQAESTLIEQKRSAQALEAEMTHVRMVSTSPLAQRLERMIRQVSRELGKEVRFECICSQGEIDRKILENLIFPLEHMVRNALDHGIEPAQLRKAQGKPAYGSIILSLHKQGNEMVIQLADDGQGLDVEKICQRAIEKRLWDPKKKMSLTDASQIILLPGFSTKEEITPISGRGVGLDVAIVAINKLGGTLQVDSQKNLGSQFTIRLPFTLSLNRALIFTLAKQYYAILLINLVGVARKSFSQIWQQMTHGSGKLNYLQKDYHIAFLREILAQGSRDDYKEKQPMLPIIFLKSQEKSIALVVDNLIGSQEIIIKPTGIQLQFVQEIAGLSLLGDNQVVLILNSPYMVQVAFEQLKNPLSETKVVGLPFYSPQILIIDDSPTVRQVTSRMLQRHAFETNTAKDGLEALRIMASKRPDIILLDIEMPRMNGFKMLETMRADLRYKHIPVIIITSRSGEKHLLKAQKMGATYYVNKPFKEEALVELLKKIQENMHK